VRREKHKTFEEQVVVAGTSTSTSTPGVRAGLGCLAGRVAVRGNVRGVVKAKCRSDGGGLVGLVGHRRPQAGETLSAGIRKSGRRSGQLQFWWTLQTIARFLTILFRCCCVV
jgi:hypothetical protein